MNEGKLSEKDYFKIYEKAIAEFNSINTNVRQAYSTFLVKCVVNSFLSFLQSKNLEVRNGKISKKE